MAGSCKASLKIQVFTLMKLHKFWTDQCTAGIIHGMLQACVLFFNTADIPPSHLKVKTKVLSTKLYVVVMRPVLLKCELHVVAHLMDDTSAKTVFICRNT